MNDLTAVEKIPERQKLRAMVLDSVSSPIMCRVAWAMYLGGYGDGGTDNSDHQAARCF